MTDIAIRRAIAPLAGRLLAAVFLALPGACGGGGGGPAATEAAGTLSLAGCAISAGDHDCEGTVTWTTTATAAPVLRLGERLVPVTTSGVLAVRLGIDPVGVELRDGARVLASATLRAACVSASAWTGGSCAPYATRTGVRVPTPFVEAGTAVSLEVVLFRPLTIGPYPLVVFHHGSTGNGDDPSAFRRTYANETVARFFVARGWMVAFPQRRGRGASDGLYDEGFLPDRSRYSCLRDPALAGAERALQDADAALRHLLASTGVDPSRVLLAGHSRGGILAVAQAGRFPVPVGGVLNFSGGWLGEGCADAIAVNRDLSARGGSAPAASLWLYADADPFYSLEHSRANFAAYRAAGGSGTFLAYARAPGLDGHFLVDDAALWSADVAAFLERFPPR